MFAVLAGVGGLAVGLYANLSQPKVAYVHLTEVFDAFKMKQEMQMQLERDDLASRKILDSLAYVLTAEGNVLDGQENPDPATVQDYLRRKEAYLAQRQNYEQSKQMATQQYDNQIITRMTQYIKDYGSANGYRYIFGDDGNGNIMYAEPMDDITPSVIAYLNERYSGQNQ